MASEYKFIWPAFRFYISPRFRLEPFVRLPKFYSYTHDPQLVWTQIH